MNRFVFMAIAVLLATPAFAESRWEGSQITVQGEAVAKVAPDQVMLPVTVRNENKELVAAKEENDKKVKALLSIATLNGIAKEKMKTAYTAVNPVYDYLQNSKPRLRGYEAQTSIEFTLTDISRLGTFMNAVVESGIDQVNGVSYSLQDEEKVKSDTLVKALLNAREKADRLASTASMKAGKAINIVEGGVSVNMPPPMPMVMARKGMMAGAEMAMSDMGSAPQLPSGLIEVRQTVTVTYDLQ